jgi:adenosylhomocysteine nucleosidase
MKIGIIVAMEKEMTLLLPLLENVKTLKKTYCTLYEGTLGNHEVMAMQSGIGKVNAALSTSAMIDLFWPDLVINTGVAGGADKVMHVLDFFVAEEVAYHDVWCGPGTEYGAASGFHVRMKTDERVRNICQEMQIPNMQHGLICSGDKFISTAEEVDEIKHHFQDALAVDMESATIAQVCTLRNVPFNILRVISDTPGAEENISQYENFWTDAPKEAFMNLRQILERL